jgi:hypothetical protein
MRAVRLAAVCAALLAGVAGPAAADTITNTFVPGSIVTLDYAGPASDSGSGAIPGPLLFDATLGTLDAVSILFVGSAQVTKTLDVAIGTYSVLGSLDVSIADPVSGFQTQLQTVLGSSNVSVTTAGPTDFSEGNSRILNLTSTQALGIFVGGGSLELTVTGLIEVFGPSGLVYSGIVDSMTGSSRIGDSITYTYTTPVPEPGTGVLAGLGLALLAARQRRLRARPIA